MDKIKVHEIAKKIGLSSKEVLEKAIEIGIEVKSHMSSVSEEDAKKIESKFFSTKKDIKEIKDKKDSPVIIRREVIVSDYEVTDKKEVKQETKKSSHNVGFIERDRKKDFNIVYRNKPNRPLTVNELFNTKKVEQQNKPKVIENSIKDVTKPNEIQKNENIKNETSNIQKQNIINNNDSKLNPKDVYSNNKPFNKDRSNQFNRDNQNRRPYNNNYSNGNQGFNQ